MVYRYDGGVTDANSTSSAAHDKPSNWNLPNVLTCARIVFIPVFAWLALRGYVWWSFSLFVLLMITDKIDGDIARARNLITDFGKIMDPIADKALMATALVCLNLAYGLPWWITAVILFREFGITLWRMFMLRQGKVVPASKGGKLKTVLQSFAVALYLCPLPGWMDPVALMVMLLAVVVTVVTGVQYLVDGYRENSRA